MVAITRGYGRAYPGRALVKFLDGSKRSKRSPDERSDIRVCRFDHNHQAQSAGRDGQQPLSDVARELP
jgi:hypothetical protein